jgi:hypothetical protein
MLIAITLIAGIAVFGWVNGQAGSATQAVGNSVASNVNFLNEHEVIALAYITDDAHASVWVFNNGILALPLGNCGVAGQGCFTLTSAASPFTPVNGCTTTASTVSPGTMTTSPFVLSCPASSFTTGSGYTVTVVGQYGSKAQYTVTVIPSIALSPSSAGPCTLGVGACTITVTGKFFTAIAGTKVYFTSISSNFMITGVDTNSVTTTCVTDAKGSFTGASCQFSTNNLVDQVGSWEIMATDESGQMISAFAIFQDT